jgi:hypothetical protein
VSLALGRWAAVAAFQVVIDQAHGLHEGIHGGRANKRPASAAQVLAHRLGLRAVAELQEGGVVEDRGAGLGVGLEPPDIGGQAAELCGQLGW